MSVLAGVSVGDRVRVVLSARYVDLVGSTAVFEGSGGVSRVNKALIDGVSGLKWQEEQMVRVEGYARTIGKRGGLLLGATASGGHSASISGKQIQEVKVLS